MCPTEFTTSLYKVLYKVLFVLIDDSVARCLILRPVSTISSNTVLLLHEDISSHFELELTGLLIEFFDENLRQYGKSTS